MQDTVSSCSSTPSTKRVLWVEKKEETPKRSKQTLEPSTNDTNTQYVCNTPLSNALPQINEDVTVTPKRQGYLSWDDYFLAVAILSSKRSKDPKSPTGACIVDRHNRIIAVGYNGFPQGCSDDVFPWNEAVDEKSSLLHTKDPYVCHAVTNAILNAVTNDVANCRIYVTSFPNSDCAKVIIQSRVDEVVILETSTTNENKDDDEDDVDMETQASRILFTMANVKLRYCKPSSPGVTLDFVPKLTPTTVPANETIDLAQSNKIEADAASRQVAATQLEKEAGYIAADIKDNGKRKQFISWQDYFMAMAFLTAERSKDPNTQVGACIVDAENKILGLGYNGFPRGCSDDHLPWARCNPNKLHNKYLYVCHAEVNAILNKGSANVKGATIYVALFPCENCAKMIIQAGIREVVYMSDSYHDLPGTKASRIMLNCAGVKLRHYIPSMQKLVLEF